MDTVGKLCPDLTSYSEELTLSTTQRTVGTIVRFLCPGIGFLLEGPRDLICLPSETWSGTIPQCVRKPTVGPTMTSIADMIANTTATTDDAGGSSDVGGATEGGISTLIIILWGAGGVLLITLIVLMACILRSHKKGRETTNNSRSNIFRTRSSRGNPGHGGVNPSFTSYDEIWTWIPVVRDTQANCQSQITPQERDQSTHRLGRDLTQTMTPPSYVEAVTETHNQRERNRNTTATAASATARVFTSGESEHAYATIPADISSSATLPIRPSVSTRQPEQHQSVETNVQVSNTRALTPSVQSPMLNRSRQTAPMPVPSTSSNDNSATEQRSRGGNSGQDSPNSRSHANNLRQCSYTFYPQYTRAQIREMNESSRNEAGFTHSEGSMFAYYTGQNGRRVYCDVPPSLWDEDGPPPYNHRHSRNNRRNSQAGSAPIMSLDYDYF